MDNAELPVTLQVEARLRIEQVCAITGLGRSKIYQEIKQKRFPAPERRGLRCSRWRAADVLEWLQATRGSPDGT